MYSVSRRVLSNDFRRPPIGAMPRRRMDTATANPGRLDGCVRLPLRVDAARLAAELSALPEAAWHDRGRDPVVLGAVDSLFVVGYPRGRRLRPADDRPVLAQLPYLRDILHRQIAPAPKRAVVARQQPGGLVPVHTDAAHVFRDLVRLSIQVAADHPQNFFCGGRWYRMAVGEVWAVDNLKPHAIRNDGSNPRINVIVDYDARGPLAELISAGDADLGCRDDDATQVIERDSRALRHRQRWKFRWFVLSRLLRRT